MKNYRRFCALFALPLFLLGACSKTGQHEPPQTPPDKVVLKFFGLLADGGKLANREALQQVTDKYGPVSPDSFRRWTEQFTSETNIKIVGTKLPDKPDKDGFYVAVVKMEVLTPSIFGGNAVTYSQMNLILDEKSNQWKVDFMANSVNEEHFQKAPQTAIAEEETEIEQVAAEKK